LPDDWSSGSHAARGQYSSPEAADAYSTGASGPYRARTVDAYGAGTADSYGGGNANAFGGPAADTYGAGKADGSGAWTADGYGAGKADGSGAWTADGYGAGKADGSGAWTADGSGARATIPYGAGSADPFGDAGPFGARNADPFGAGTADSYGAGSADSYGAGSADAGSGRADAGQPTAAIRYSAPGEGDEGKVDPKGFLSALFDFGFTSFVTPKVIKALYMLIMIGTVASALVFTISVFKVSAAFGLLTLIFGDPLFILIVMAIYRIILEFFVVIFRVAEDIRALRERGLG
jgi:hypothetical protein